MRKILIILILLFFAPMSLYARPPGGHGGGYGPNFGHGGPEGGPSRGYPYGHYRGDHYRGDDRYRGDRYRGDRYRGDRYRGDRYRGDHYRGDRYRGDRYYHRNRYYDDWRQGGGYRRHHRNDWIVPVAVMGGVLGLATISQMNNNGYYQGGPRPSQRQCRDSYNYYDNNGNFMYTKYVDRPCR